jgi:WD40 repeat protein
VWDLVSGRPIVNSLTGHTGLVMAVALGDFDGRSIAATGNNDGTVWVWDPATGRPIGDPFTGHLRYVNTVAVGELAGRPVVVSGGTDETVRIWDLRTRTATALSVGAKVRAVAVAEGHLLIGAAAGVACLRPTPP